MNSSIAIYIVFSEFGGFGILRVLDGVDEMAMAVGGAWFAIRLEMISTNIRWLHHGLPTVAEASIPKISRNIVEYFGGNAI